MFKMSLSNSQIYSTVLLTVVTTLCITSSEPSHLITGHLYTLGEHLHLFLPIPSFFKLLNYEKPKVNIVENTLKNISLQAVYNISFICV